MNSVVSCRGQSADCSWTSQEYGNVRVGEAFTKSMNSPAMRSAAGLRGPFILKLPEVLIDLRRPP